MRHMSSDESVNPVVLQLVSVWGVGMHHVAELIPFLFLRIARQLGVFGMHGFHHVARRELQLS